MVADHAEEGLTIVVEIRHGEDRTGVVDYAGIVGEAVVDRTAEGDGCSSEAHSLDDSFEVPMVEVEGVAVDHAEGRVEEGHAAEGGDCSATDHPDNLLVGRSAEEDLAVQELEGRYMVQGYGDHIQLVGRDLEEDPAVVGLEHVVGHCSRLYAGKVKRNENHHVRLDCRLCRLEEHHRLVEVAAHIRTEDAVAAADRSSMEEGQVGGEGGRGSCIELPTYLGVSCQLLEDSTRRG